MMGTTAYNQWNMLHVLQHTLAATTSHLNPSKTHASSPFGELPGPIECNAQPVEHINTLGGSRLAQKLTVLNTIP
jgi:hypothetical protein